MLKAGRTVLCVDDPPATLEILVQFFEFQGYKVITANDGLDALEQVKNMNLISLFLT